MTTHRLPTRAQASHPKTPPEVKLALVWSSSGADEQRTAAEWKAAFVALASRLIPDYNPDALDEASDVAFDSGAVSPDAAARRWASLQAPLPPTHLRWFDE